VLGPFITSSLSLSRFHCDTVSGIVSFFATSVGTPTSEILRLGSGEITVLLEKSTRLPESEPLNLPSLPLSLWVSVLSGLPDLWWACGMPETSLSKYVVTWYCNRSTKSCTISGGLHRRFCSLLRHLTLRLIITVLST